MISRNSIFELSWLYRLYLLSGQAWNFSGLGIILIIKYRVQTVDPISFISFSESDGPSGSFAFFSTLPVIGWRLKVQFRPTGKLVSGGFSRGCRVANRLQGFQAEASPFLKAGLETCYWWFKGQPIDILICIISLNFVLDFWTIIQTIQILVSHTHPPWKNR